MTNKLTIEQRFALSRARYEVERMSRPALEKTAIRLLRSRMMQKNGIQATLAASGILFKIQEEEGPVPEIISEETFMELISMQNDDEINPDILDEGWEDEEMDDDDNVMFF